MICSVHSTLLTVGVDVPLKSGKEVVIVSLEMSFGSIPPYSGLLGRVPYCVNYVCAP